MSSDSLLELAGWELRSQEFGARRGYDDGRPVVAMEYQPADELAAWPELCDLWSSLSPHPHIVDALDRDDSGALLLRYAAFDWNHPLLQLDAGVRARRNLASWGLQLTDAYLSIVGQLAPGDASQFRRPVVRIDLGGAARVLFLPVGADAGCDERVLVQVIGTALRGMCARRGARDLESVIERCVDPDIEARYSTLDDLREAWLGLGAFGGVRAGEQQASWMLAEEALGWLALGSPTRAIDFFENALELDRMSRVAEAGLRRAFENIGIVGGTVKAKSKSKATDGGYEPSVRIGWSDAEEQGQHLEAQRAFKEALAMYQHAHLDGASDVFIYTARARCYLALGMGSQAVDCARRALAVRPEHIEALSLRARAFLVDHRYEDALECAGVWLAADAHDASAHYTQGRALFALARYLDARAAFDRASSLRPQMIEAMLLRREADRAAARVREAVGTQPTLDIDLPEHLAGLRHALANGRVDEVIATLERSEYETDADAKLVLAHCLAFGGRFDEAIASFDRTYALSSRHERAAAIGKAHALLATHRADDALALFDRMRAQNPTDLQALEGRALALRQLGRQAEADEAQTRYVSASCGRSALRVDSVG